MLLVYIAACIISTTLRSPATQLQTAVFSARGAAITSIASASQRSALELAVFAAAGAEGRDRGWSAAGAERGRGREGEAAGAWRGPVAARTSAMRGPGGAPGGSLSRPSWLRRAADGWNGGELRLPKCE